MPLPESFLQELLARNDIESVVSGYVALKRRGRNLVGLCPFHGEKTASFNLYPETSSFYCFGCGAGGDVITFVKRIENLDYMDAVRFLADRAGMKMPEYQKENDGNARLRMRILEANREAARLYHQTLYSPLGEEALAYFHRRGYTDATIRHFGLGFAPPGWDHLRNGLKAKGFRDEELQAAFLLARGRNGGYYDVFRNRVMIPIIDIRGNVVGFGGRVLDDSKPKYINTENTLAFSKSHNLFALNFAKSAGRELNLCEGYMDVIAMHQAGFTNTVAALGTAFPQEQIQLISRYADRVNLIFDADGAGQKATQRAIENLRKTGIEVRVVSIPDGKDPDEFIRKNGADAFKLLLADSANAVEYRLLELGKKYDIRTPSGKVSYLKDATDILAALDSPVERDVYAVRLSELLGIAKESIRQEISGKLHRKNRTETHRTIREVQRREGKEMREVNPEAATFARAANAEEMLLSALLLHPDMIRQVRKELEPEHFLTAFHRRLYERLLERQEKGLPMELAFLAEEEDEAGMAYLAKLTGQGKGMTVTLPEVLEKAEEIRREHQLKGMATPSEASDEELLSMMQALRERKQTGNQRKE